VAALDLASADPGALMLLLASDHVVRHVDRLRAAVDAAEATARNGAIVALGVAPDRPETAYGYIKLGAKVGAGPCHRIAAFVEKPSRAVAEELLRQGGYCWNASMFLMPVATYLGELERFEPGIVAACRRAFERAAADLDFVRLDAATFADATAKSVDYAVMERTDKGAVLPVDLGWSDVGSWTSLHDVAGKDADGNALIGDVMAIDARNSYIRSEGRLTVAVGVRDVVVVADTDAVLVAASGASQSVKEAVDRLRAAGRPEAISHPVAYRPWGHYATIDSGPGFQVKRIVVLPGGRLSLQRHRQRAEHWVVVSGSARVTRGSEVRDLGPNQSIDIPLGTAHRLENPGHEALHLIEVQAGAYLGEDDIERLDDVYGRTWTGSRP
jgi:mannose-1-phosphate guanylyltransferase/mannose-6-phosphate isomerase